MLDKIQSILNSKTNSPKAAIACGDFNGDPSMDTEKYNSDKAKISKMIAKLELNNRIKVLNHKLAADKHTCKYLNGNSGINDLMITRANDHDHWERMDITNPEKVRSNEYTQKLNYHYMIHTTSTIKLKTTNNNKRHKYVINWNDGDDKCNAHYQKNINLPLNDKLMNAYKNEMKNVNNQDDKQQITDAKGAVIIAMLTISAIKTYGIKIATTNNSQNSAYENSNEETKDIIKDYKRLVSNAQNISKETNTQQYKNLFDKIQNKPIKKDNHNNKTNNIQNTNQLNTKSPLLNDIKNMDPKLINSIQITNLRNKLKQEEIRLNILKYNNDVRHFTFSNMQELWRRNSRRNNEHNVPFPDELQNIDTTFSEFCVGYNNFQKQLYAAPTDEKPIIEVEQNNFAPDDSKIFTKKIIQDVIKKSKKSSAPGITTLTYKFYHEGKAPMIKMLLSWYNAWQEYDTIPKYFKIDIKTVLQKYGLEATDRKKSNPANYRPIALQNIIYKIMDGCVLRKLNRHNDKNGTIVPNQAGFKANEGTIEHMFNISTIFEHNPNVKVAFLDLKKAFDTVRRDSLIEKLEKIYKMDIKTTNFINTMYKNTYSATRHKNRMSTVIETHKGVQQGALSSPVLFNMFINDLLQELNNCPAGCTINELHINNLGYADDIALFANTEKGLQALLNICSKWADKWGLKFSADKSKMINANNRPCKGRFILQKFEVEQITGTYKYLGVPICGTGIDVAAYHKQILRKFRGTKHVIHNYCDKNNLDFRHRKLTYVYGHNQIPNSIWTRNNWVQ